MYSTKKKLFQAELTLLRNKERHPYLHSLLEYLSKDSVVLDLGCGLLVNSHYLKDNGLNVIGADISFEMLTEENGGEVPLICANGLRLPFKQNSFGGLILVDIIEHLPREKVDEFMEEIARILKGGGIIFLHVPLEKSIIYRLLNMFKVIWPKNQNHLHDYNLKEIMNVINENNFTVLWDHKENGIVYSFYYHLKKMKLSIMVAKLMGRFLQNFFAASYTACLSFTKGSKK